ncbi:MAG: 2-hydroxyacid dehydrogenase [Treponema sp.]|nr:2-hydroxyacid dehydrogenase [Candidatus Treponema caballi]
MKIAFFDAKEYDRASFHPYEDEALEFRYLEDRLSENTADLAAGCEGICVFVNDVMSASVIDRLYAEGVRFILLRCAGYNNVDLAYCKGKMPVFRVPAYSPFAVAEHAMAMLLTSIRRIHKAYNRTREFNFSLSGLTGFDLHGKTAGVIGTGKIGRAFINICRGFGMNVLAYDKFPSPDLETVPRALKADDALSAGAGPKAKIGCGGMDCGSVCYVPLGELFEKSDIISLHCPLTEETHHIIDAASITAMKKGVVIVNTSRGALIDAEALLEGIKSRKIGAVCLDVYEEEAGLFFNDFSGHIVPDDLIARLISMPNVLVTSHQAFLTKEALAGIAETTVDNIYDYVEKGGGENEVAA